METIGARIARLRKEKNIKQESLAETLGVSAQAVSKWENDVSCPDISLLPALARTLGVSVDELLSGKSQSELKIVPESERKPIEQLILRIHVDSSDGDKVRVNLPLALIDSFMKLGMSMPQLNGIAALDGIDIAQVLSIAQSGVIGNIIEVESADGDFVKIFVE